MASATVLLLPARASRRVTAWLKGVRHGFMIAKFMSLHQTQGGSGHLQLVVQAMAHLQDRFDFRLCPTTGLIMQGRCHPSWYASWPPACKHRFCRKCTYRSRMDREQPEEPLREYPMNWARNFGISVKESDTPHAAVKIRWSASLSDVPVAKRLTWETHICWTIFRGSRHKNGPRRMCGLQCSYSGVAIRFGSCV